MKGLAETVFSSLNTRSLQSIAQQLGLSPQAAAPAILAALSLLLGQMSRNAAQPDAAAALLGAARRDHATPPPGADFDGLFGAPGSDTGSQALSGGLAILGHIFGDGRDTSQPQVPEVAGLDRNGSLKLLALLAPLVMRVLGQLSQNGQIDASSLDILLNQESERISRAPTSLLSNLLGATLDRDGDGQIGIGEVLQGTQALDKLFGKQ